jgi:hypothetical protein
MDLRKTTLKKQIDEEFFKECTFTPNINENMIDLTFHER